MDTGSVYHFIFLRIQAEVVQSLYFSTVKPWFREMKDLALLQRVNLVKTWVLEQSQNSVFLMSSPGRPRLDLRQYLELHV